MAIRAFHPDDAPVLAKLVASASRGEVDFVLNPLWSSEAELFGEFQRFGIDPAEHMWVTDSGGDSASGLAGFLRHPEASVAALLCPIVERDERRRGLGGELLRATLDRGASKLGIELAVAAIGARNRAGYSLLSSHGFRPVRQHFLMHCKELAKGAPKAPANTRIDAARPDDAAAIHEIYRECGFDERSEETMARVLGDGIHDHAVVRDECQGGKIVAFTELETHWPTRVWVAYVGVARDFRDKGLGSAVVAWTLARRFANETSSALLLLSPANRTALRAYEKVGFRRHRVVDVLEKRL